MLVRLDHLQNFKSAGHVVQILQTSPFFTQITHFLDNRWSEVWHALLGCHYLPLVQISSRYHFQILRYKILGLIWAKRVIWGRPVKYTHMTGGKKLTLPPKITPYRKSTCKIWTKKYWQEKELEGVLLAAFSKNDDVITGQWRHLWWQNLQR